MGGPDFLNRLTRTKLLDLVFCSVLSVVAAILALVAVPLLFPLRFLLGVLLAVVLPGYALVSIVFPEGPVEEDDEDPSKTVLGRAVFSVGLSVVVVPVLAITAQYAGFGIRVAPMAVGLALVTVSFSILAAIRRLSLPPENRFSLESQLPDPLDPLRWAQKTDRINQALVGLLAISLLTATGGAAYATFGPAEYGGTTEFYLLSQDRTGSYVASDYPTEFVTGEPQTLGIGIANDEGQLINYTVVVSVQETSERSRGAEVLNSTTVERRVVPVADGEERVVETDIELPMTGTNLRLMFELYTDPTETSEPYRTTYLWVNSTNAGSTEGVSTS